MENSVRLNRYLILAWMMLILLVIQSQFAPMPAWTGLVGDKRTATLDLWSPFGHFPLGVFWAGFWHQWTKERLSIPLLRSHWYLRTLTCLCAWEFCELPMELGVFGEHFHVWMAGVEHWSNRFIGDPLVGTIGCLAYRLKPRIFWPATFIGFSWEILNHLYPTCMTFQEQVLNIH